MKYNIFKELQKDWTLKMKLRHKWWIFLTKIEIEVDTFYHQKRKGIIEYSLMKNASLCMRHLCQMVLISTLE